MRLLNYVLIAFFVLVTAGMSDVFAQSTVLDGIYIREHVPARRVIPYTPLREGDVMWMKRMWRRLDLREKMNHPFYYPEQPLNGRMSLFDVIKQAVLKDGSITAYDPGPLGDDDQFTKQFTVPEVQGKLSKLDTVWTQNLMTGAMEPTTVQNDVSSSQIKWYDIKEEWYFDKQKSVLEARIIGICPMKEKIDQNTGEFRGVEPLFWIYFPEARYVFANAPVFNRFNDSERRTYEDIFWKRQFGSFVTKESNVYDRFIAEYKSGLDALLEAEKIKEQVFFLEHDLWSF